MNLKAANNILREQVMLKERRSNARLWTMTMVFGIQFPAMITTVKTLSSQDLWPRFIFLMPASVPTVRLPQHSLHDQMIQSYQENIACADRSQIKRNVF